MDHKISIKKIAFFIMVATILSKVLGFVREIVLANYYGASNISDAYLISQTIPGVIFSFVGLGISTGYIPIYSSILGEKGIDKANQYTSKITNLVLIISLIIIMITLIFTEPIVKLFASGFDGEALNLTIELTRIFVFGVFLSGILSIFSGFLQVNGHFITPAIAGVPFNLIIIISIFLSTIWDIKLLIIGSLLAKLFEFLIMVPYIRKYKYKYSPDFNFNDRDIKNMIKMSLPLIIGVSVNQINLLIDRTIASNIAVGGVSALNYSSRLNEFIQGIFVLSIATTIFPLISRYITEKKIEKLKKTISDSISLINLFIIPASLGCMIFCKEIVNFLYFRGEFDSTAATMTTNSLFFFSIGMLAFAHREILSRIFYADKDTKTPMINASIGIVINIIFNIILTPFIGISGLALGSSLSGIVTAILLFYKLSKHKYEIDFKLIYISGTKIVISSLIMVLLSKSFFFFIESFTTQNIALILSISSGALVYFVLLIVLKVQETEIFIKMLKAKFTKK